MYAWALALDDTSVYFLEGYYSDSGPVHVRKVAKSGGNVATLAAFDVGNGGSYFPSIALDATSVYWTHNEFVMKVSKQGGQPETLVVTPGDYTRLVAADATSVYWTSWGHGTVAKVGNDGANPTVLTPPTDELPTALAVDSSGVYFTTWGGGSLSHTSKVQRIGLDGGAPVVLDTTDLYGYAALVVGANDIYWTAWDERAPTRNGAIMKMPKNGGVGTVLASWEFDSTQPLAVAATFTSLAVTSTSAYWTKCGPLGDPGCWVMGAPTTGGNAAELTSVGDTMYESIAADDSSVYFTSQGSLWKVPR
jgi:hypothetical protein